MSGATIDYAEIDSIRVCILPDGQWCEREHGHSGAHALSPTSERDETP